MAKVQEEPKGIFAGVLDGIKEFFRVQFQAVWEDYTNIWPRAVIKAVTQFGKLWDDFSVDTWSFWLGYFKKWGLIDDDDMKSIIETRKAFGIFSPFYMLLMLYSMLMQWVKIKMGVMSGTMQQRMNKQHSPNVPDPNAMISAMFIAPEKASELKERIMASGLSVDDIDKMIIANYATYPEQRIRDLFFRGVIAQDKAIERMRELHLTDTRIKELMGGWEILPTMQDIVKYLGREAFEPKMIDMFGLMEDYPAEAEEWGQRLGIDPRWVKAEWVSHWEPPPLTTMLEAFQRRIVSWEEVENYMKLVEVPPRFREIVRDMAYNPYTRVDIRRMHADEVLTDEQAYYAYRDIGYDHEHALNMTVWTKKYNAKSDKDITMGQIKTAYKSRAITKEQATKFLITADYTQDKALWLIALWDLGSEEEYQSGLIDNVGARYVNNMIEENDAIKRLGELNIPSRQVQFLMDTWKIKREVDKAKHSKTDLGKMYIEKIIDRDDYLSLMRKIGYTFDQITRYLELMDKTKKAI
jgi:hypothetical protein